MLITDNHEAYWTRHEAEKHSNTKINLIFYKKLNSEAPATGSTSTPPDFKHTKDLTYYKILPLWNLKP